MRQVKIYTLSGPKGVRYVGKTISTLRARLSQHICEKNRCHKVNWVKSLEAKGIEPTIELLELVDEDVWKEREIYWIQQFKDWGFDLVNTALGGEGGGDHLGVSIQKLNRDTGEVITTYKSISEAIRATGFNAANVSQVCNGHVKTAYGFYWKFTDDKDYVFEPFVKPSPYNQRAVQQLDKSTGEVLDTFESLAMAGEAIGLVYSAISKACSGSIAGGYKWKFKDDKDYVFEPYVDTTLKSVQQLDKDTGEVLATFESLAQANRSTGVGTSDICGTLKGNQKSAGGYKWKYTDDKDYVFTPYKIGTKAMSVQQLDKVTGEVLNTFESIAEARRVTVGTSKIGEVCLGNRKTSGGYKWRYTPTK